MLKKVVVPVLILLVAFGAYKLMNADDAPKAKPGNAQAQSTQTEKADAGQTPKEGDENKDGEEKKEEQPASRGRGPMGTGVLARQGATSVEVLAAKPAIRRGQVQLFGTVEARQQATITATSTAEVISLNVNEGDKVSKGQSLLTLSADSAQETLQQRKSALAELEAGIRIQELKHKNDLASLEIDKELLAISKKSVDRFSSLNSQQLSSSSDYEDTLRTYQSQLLSVQARELTIAQYEDTRQQLLAQRESLQSQIRQAQELVDDLNVHAPFDGIIAKIDIVAGQELRSGETIAQIYNPSALAVYVRVPMRYRLDLLPISDIKAIDRNGQAWQARSIRPINETGAQRLTLEPVAGSTSTHLPGSHVSVTVSYPIAQPTVEVPFTAVYDQQRIYVAEQGALRATDIEILGNTKTGYLIAADAITEGESIVTTRLKNPLTGMTVSVARANTGAKP